MAAGECVSVCSQADSEQAALNLERRELETDDPGKRRELTAMHVGRGVQPAFARQVAEQFMAHDALGAHARDELGISEMLQARPIQGALASAASYVAGAAMPSLVVATVSAPTLMPAVSETPLAFLAPLPARLAARVGGAGVTVGALRVIF